MIKIGEEHNVDGGGTHLKLVLCFNGAEALAKFEACRNTLGAHKVNCHLDAGPEVADLWQGKRTKGSLNRRAYSIEREGGSCGWVGWGVVKESKRERKARAYLVGATGRDKDGSFWYCSKC